MKTLLFPPRPPQRPEPIVLTRELAVTSSVGMLVLELLRTFFAPVKEVP